MSNVSGASGSLLDKSPVSITVANVFEAMVDDNGRVDLYGASASRTTGDPDADWVSDVAVSGSGELVRPGWTMDEGTAISMDFRLLIDGDVVWAETGAADAAGLYYWVLGGDSFHGSLPFVESFELQSRCTNAGITGGVSLKSLFAYRLNI